MNIRPAAEGDREVIWGILEPTIRAGETYALPREMSQVEALHYWFAPGNKVFVAEAAEGVAGTYILRTNQAGGGAHVCNCGYMTAAWAQGRGVARSMCLHSLEQARAAGYRAMQFNFVVSSNARAVRLWESLGFQVVGTLPGAFAHPTRGFVDVFVMYQSLASSGASLARMAEPTKS
jgi:L-amino acid N-acyltransferase YncA